MARTKQSKNQHHFYHRRTSWTRFHLPCTQDWPSAWTGHSDVHFGPLAGVAGCRKVWLGRKVEDPEQAALIVLWHTADDLKNFQHSPACAEFLRGLPEHDVQASLLSGALLQGLSLGDAKDDDAPSPSSAPSRFHSLQWTSPYGFEDDLQGRVTLTAFEIAYTGVPSPGPWRSVLQNTFGHFVPGGCEDLLQRWPPTRMQNWTAWAAIDTEDARVDSDHSQLGQQAATAGNESGRAVLCEFRRWNGYTGATPEREEASAKSPLARESWAQAVAKLMPPITAWEQERWDIQLAPREVEEEEGEDEEPEFQRELDEWRKERAL
ncbi:hypothetical protein C8A00DRAFT_18107 [Chaetomidium leptoderma]|uniref:Uncharacterized protein n=1 Tax=Chaetomidium leptoderma TaxID=669021 RepID=A0AAN6VFI5_9PEZI|nr:hypothetical protein C8A00DRAFT_18107 [Chaetomidium leptoderma]